MLTQTQQGSATFDRGKATLDKRLEGLFWALLFILVGTIWLFPEERVPDGTWLVGIGLILLGLNGVRYANGIPIRVFPSLLGALALAAGLGAMAGAQLPLLPLTFIVIGASIILELTLARQRAPRR